MTPPEPSSTAMIQARGLVKHYGDVRAVDGVSFEVARGELVGFLGPNGAGKSTTMRMLTGVLHPDQGGVSIAGHSLDAAPLAARARVGYLPEHTPLYREMRVDRYLAFVAALRGFRGAARRGAVHAALEAADLDGYTTRRIRTLSKGYRQRVGLAQALIADPDVLVLDEPTSGLDPAEIVRIRERIAALARTKTILLSTHVLSEVEEVCRRVIILAQGKVVADGTLDELAAAEGEALLVTLGVVGDEARRLSARLVALPGVRDVEVLPEEAGRARMRLEVEGRWAVADRISRLAREEAWPLLELTHDVPTLERVFLSRIRRLAEEQLQ